MRFQQHGSAAFVCRPTSDLMSRLDDPTTKLSAEARNAGAVHTSKIPFTGPLRVGFMRASTMSKYLSEGL